MEESAQVFSALLRSIERSRAELAEVIQKKQMATEMRAKTSIKGLESEISELQKRRRELEQLFHHYDHLHVVQVRSLEVRLIFGFSLVSALRDVLENKVRHCFSHR